MSLLRHVALEPGGVHAQPCLARHDLCEVERETLFVVEPEGESAADLLALAVRLCLALEKRDAAVECAVEILLLALDDAGDLHLLLDEFGKHAAHPPDQPGNELVKERRVEPERPSVAHRTAQDAAQDVMAFRVAGHDAVGDGEAERAQVVGDNAEGHVDALLLGVARGTGGRERGAVLVAAEFLDGVEDRPEHIRFVIGNPACEIGKMIGVLDDAHHALETHAGIDVARGQWTVGAVPARR